MQKQYKVQNLNVKNDLQLRQVILAMQDGKAMRVGKNASHIQTAIVKMYC